MGSWGPEPFENDTALDFLGDLKDGPVELVEDRLTDAMTAVLDDAHELERAQMEVAIAAACLVAARAQGDLSVPETVSDYLREWQFRPDLALIGLASQVLDRAFNPDKNEWYRIRGVGIGDVRGAIEKYKVALRACS